MASLSTILSSLQKGFLKNILTGAGLTLATGGVVLTAFNTAVDQFKNSLGALSAMTLDFAGLIGLDVAFSVILGAIAARYVQNTAKVYLARK